MKTPVSIKTVGAASRLYSVVAAATEDDDDDEEEEDLSQILDVQLWMLMKVLFLFIKKFYGLMFRFHYIHMCRART